MLAVKNAQNIFFFQDLDEQYAGSIFGLEAWVTEPPRMNTDGEHISTFVKGRADIRVIPPDGDEITLVSAQMVCVYSFPALQLLCITVETFHAACSALAECHCLPSCLFGQQSYQIPC